MHKELISVDAEKLAIGLQAILLDLVKNGKEGRFPVDRFETMVMEQKGITHDAAQLVTEKIINTGILRWDIFGNYFVL